jgi:hypothetical protein
MKDPMPAPEVPREPARNRRPGFAAVRDRPPRGHLAWMGSRFSAARPHGESWDGTFNNKNSEAANFEMTLKPPPGGSPVSWESYTPST